MSSHAPTSLSSSTTTLPLPPSWPCSPSAADTLCACPCPMHHSWWSLKMQRQRGPWWPSSWPWVCPSGRRSRSLWGHWCRARSHTFTPITTRLNQHTGYYHSHMILFMFLYLCSSGAFFLFLWLGKGRPVVQNILYLCFRRVIVDFLMYLLMLLWTKRMYFKDQLKESLVWSVSSPVAPSAAHTLVNEGDRSTSHKTLGIFDPQLKSQNVSAQCL